MQASPINAAQLMMEFLDREQVDIGQGIIAAEFSKELEKQERQIDGGSSETPLSPRREALSGKSLSPPRSDALEPGLSDSPKGSAAVQRSKSLKRLVSDGRPVKNTRTGIQDEMLFTSPILLEKVLADLKVPAEARKACTSAEDKQGRLSLGSLLNILDRQVGDGASLNPGKAPGRDVEALLKSLALPRGHGTLALRHLVTKPQGVYSLKELREVLDKAAKQLQEAKAPQSPTGDESGGQAAPLGQLKAGSGEKSPSVSIPTRSTPLMASSVPSFVGDNAPEEDLGGGVGKPSPAAGPPETGNIVPVNGGSATQLLRPEAVEVQRSLSVPGLDPTVVETSSHPASASEAKQVGPSAQSFPGPAMETLDQGRFAQGSGRESIENRVKVPGELLADTRAISIQEGSAPIREGFSKAVSTWTESIADPETRSTDLQPAAKLSESAFDSAQTHGRAPNQQSFDLRGQAFAAYSPASQGIAVNGTSLAPLRGETLSLANPSWPVDMAQRIQELARDRRTTHLTLELEPEGLGRLTLRVETRHDEVTAAVTAEKEQARVVLLRNTQALRQNLEQQGLTLGQFLVDVRGERGSRHVMSDQRFAKHAPRGGAEAENQHLQREHGIVWIRSGPSHLINVLA